MIRKLILAALVALVAAPAVSLYSLGLLDLCGWLPATGGVPAAQVGSLIPIGLI